MFLCCESYFKCYVSHHVWFSRSILAVPEIESTSLQSLLPELSDYRKHMAVLLQSWEKDNTLVYFNKVSEVRSLAFYLSVYGFG